MTNVNELYSYIKEFGVSSKVFRTCLRSVASEFDELSVNDAAISILADINKITSSHNSIKLKRYQLSAVHHLLKNRGLIAAFDTGSGKTLTAIASAEVFLTLSEFFGFDHDVIVITPPTLMENFKKEMDKYGVPDHHRSKYTFFTKIKFGREWREKKVNCANSFVIIDEAHQYRTDYLSRFTNAHIKTDKTDKKVRSEVKDIECILKCTKNAAKVLLLTATPAYNSTVDIFNLVEMVKGQDLPPVDPHSLLISTKNKMVLSEKFKKLFADVFIFHSLKKAKGYPARINKVVNLEMTKEYLKLYEEQESDAMKKITAKPSKRAKSSKNIELDIPNIFMVKMRKASNVLEGSPKVEYTISLIEEFPTEKILVYSFFKSAGINLIKTILDKKSISYLVISGDTPIKQRQDIVHTFNTSTSTNVLLVTKAGSEGLDLVGVRRVVLFEKGWNVAQYEQVIGRSIRYRSHSHLLSSERNVTVYHLLATKPSDYILSNNSKTKEVRKFKGEVINMYDGSETIPVSRHPEKLSADVYLFEHALEKQKKIEEMLKILESISIK